MSSASAAASADAGGADRSCSAVDGDRSLCRHGRCAEVGKIGAEGVVELAGDVALKAADDFGLGQSFGGATVGVGAGASAVAESADGDQVECAVGLTVAAAVEPVSARASGGG